MNVFKNKSDLPISPIQRSVSNGRQSTTTSQSSQLSSTSTNSGVLVSPPTSPGSLPSLEDIDKRFTDAEIEYNKLFAESRTQQKLLFLQSVVAQNDTEAGRNEELHKLLATARQAYYADRQQRDVLFRAGMERRGVVFAVQEKDCEEFFSSAQDSREMLFKETREHRLKRVEEYIQHRDGLFTKGRGQREELGDRLVKMISTQFGELLAQGSSNLLLAQEKYEERAESLTPRERKHEENGIEVNTSNFNVGDYHIPLSPTIVRGPPTPAPAPYPIIIPGPISRSPSWSSRSSRSRYRSRSRSRSRSPVVMVPPHIISHPTGSNEDTSQPSKDSIQFNPEVSLTGYLDYYNRLFQDQEGRRDTIFSGDQDSYSAAFDKVEAKRKKAGTKWMALLTEHTYEKQFRDDQEQHKYLFNQQVAAFNHKASYRETLYTNAQTTFSLTFEQDQTWIKKSFGSVNTTEKKVWDWLRSKVINFLEQHSDSVEKLIRNHDETFDSFLVELKRRLEPDELSTTNIINLPPSVYPIPPFLHEPGIIPFEPPTIIPLFPPPIVTMPPISPPTIIAVPPRRPSRVPSPEPIRPQISAPSRPPFKTGPAAKPQSDNTFSPHTLFTSKIFSNKLPVPTTQLYLYDATRSGLLKMLQDQNVLFIQGQDKRQRLFEENMRTKWTSDPASELEKGMKFKEEVNKYKSQAEKKSLEQFETFSKEQLVREKSFAEAEERRQREFVEKIKRDQESFKREMEDMERKFYTQMENLMESAYSGEVERMEEMARFEATQLREIHVSLNTCKGKLRAAAKNMEKRFNEFVRSF